MKSSIICLLAIATFFIACKKDQVKTPPAGNNQDKHVVQFDVAAFSQEIVDINNKSSSSSTQFKTAADSLKNYVNYLYYVVFDAQTRQVVKTISQNSTSSNFGHLNDTLPTGKYIIAIAAAQDPILTTYYLIPDNPGFVNLSPGSDVFYRKMELTISGAVAQPVVLERIVSKVTVIIKDQIPYTAKYFTYWPKDTIQAGLAPYFSYLTGTIIRGSDRFTTETRPANIYIADSTLGTTYYQFSFYVLNTDTRKMDLELQCHKGSFMAPIAEKTIRNILLVKNKKTIVSGAFFAPVGSGTTVNVDGAWQADSISVSF